MSEYLNMNIQNQVFEVRSFNRFYTNIISVLDQSVLKSGYSLAEARIIFEINQKISCSARQIMDLLTIDEGYLSRILSKLVENDLVRKVRSESDKDSINWNLLRKAGEKPKGSIQFPVVMLLN